MESKTMKRFHFLSAGLWPASLIFTRRFAFPLLVLNAGLALVQPCAGAPFQFEETGSMLAQYSQHTATLLNNGKVLAAGGSAGDSAELYDSAIGTWTATGNLTTGRYLHTATLLPNGKVLVVGGSGLGGYLASCELYDPISATWSQTGSLAHARTYHTATVLP